ncbi:J domain-containing protein [Acaryochloris sp. IP29b_bin.137]|uniref:J domain-containing protein n=1 Tax=Acaryochloris sp. IP29b_bin.137 TaxID=2969217 RepID=UPI002628D9D1|nr:J domain-containing protein [Acaryochloris sp. IP29b_bin.137]
MADLQPYFQLLRVSAEVTPAELKAAFRRRARECHPDLHPDNPNAEAEFQQLSEAYDIISKALYPAHQAAPFIYADGSDSQSPAQALYTRATQKAAERDYEGAIKDYTRAIEYDPKFVDAYLRRCQIWFVQGEDENVLADCNEILKLDDTVAQAYYYQGRARFQLGSAPSAIASYSQAIALDENYAQAWLHRGRARREMNADKLAREDLTHAAALFEAQGEPDEVHRVQMILQEMGRRPFTKPKVKPSEHRGLVQDIFSTIPQFFWNPSGGLLPTFARLSARRATEVGVGYAGLSIIGFVLAANLFPGAFSAVSWAERLMLSAVPFVSLVFLNQLARSLTRTRGSWASDIFISGATLLPLSLLIFLSELVAQFGAAAVWIASFYLGCDAILILYVGCTQINNLSEQSATLAVPTLLWVTSAITYGTFTLLAN